MSIDTFDRFTMAVFVLDGTLEVTREISVENLSKKWMSICAEYLNFHGNAFDAPWSGNLSHIRTKFTSTSGSALATLFFNDKIISTFTLTAGISEISDASVVQMFIESLRSVDVVRRHQQSPDAFKEATLIPERPLMIYIPWFHEGFSDEDYELARELAVHLSAAFFELEFRERKT